tara:strand:- start:358 stop:570 length:213 start_codon:yes stop_codon:yes gene_type:complete
MEKYRELIPPIEYYQKKIYLTSSKIDKLLEKNFEGDVIMEFYRCFFLLDFKVINEMFKKLLLEKSIQLDR